MAWRVETAGSNRLIVGTEDPGRLCVGAHGVLQGDNELDRLGGCSEAERGGRRRCRTISRDAAITSLCPTEQPPRAAPSPAQKAAMVAWVAAAGEAVAVEGHKPVAQAADVLWSQQIISSALEDVLEIT